jgi:hypothetical protein
VLLVLHLVTLITLALRYTENETVPAVPPAASLKRVPDLASPSSALAEPLLGRIQEGRESLEMARSSGPGSSGPGSSGRNSADSNASSRPAGSRPVTPRQAAAAQAAAGLASEPSAMPVAATAAVAVAGAGVVLAAAGVSALAGTAAGLFSTPEPVPGPAPGSDSEESSFEEAKSDYASPAASISGDLDLLMPQLAPTPDISAEVQAALDTDITTNSSSSSSSSPAGGVPGTRAAHSAAGQAAPAAQLLRSMSVSPAAMQRSTTPDSPPSGSMPKSKSAPVLNDDDHPPPPHLMSARPQSAEPDQQAAAAGAAAAAVAGSDPRPTFSSASNSPAHSPQRPQQGAAIHRTTSAEPYQPSRQQSFAAQSAPLHAQQHHQQPRATTAHGHSDIPAPTASATGQDPFNPEEPYKLRLVGHSLGGASALIYLVMRYREGVPHHVSRLVLLTPAGFHKRLPLLANLLVPPLYYLFAFLSLFWKGLAGAVYIPTFLARALAFKLSLDVSHIPALNELMRMLFRTALSGDSSQWDRALQLPHYRGKDMPAVSIGTLRHLFQQHYSGRFQLYDYGSRAANIRNYGTPEPPDIAQEYSRIRIPVDLMSGQWRRGVCLCACMWRNSIMPWG